MKKSLISISLALLMLALPVVSVYAQDGDLPECFGDPLVAYLMAGQDILAGELIVCNDATNLYVSYVLYEGWRLSDTHVQIDVIDLETGVTGTIALDDYPVNKKGTPVPGQFDYQMDYDPTVQVSTYTIPLADIIDGWDGTNYDYDLLIAAHATLGERVTNDAGSDSFTGSGSFETILSVPFSGDQILESSLTIACKDTGGADVSYTASLNGTDLQYPVSSYDFSEDLLFDASGTSPYNLLVITPDANATCTVEASVVTPGEGEETAWAYDAENGGTFDTNRWSAYLVYTLQPPLEVVEWPSSEGMLSLAFEDAEGVDYDYNDWVVDVKTLVTYELGRVTGIDFEFFPEARGAWHTHAFHMRFPAGVFDGEVTGTLTLYDADGNEMSVESNVCFDGSGAECDFTVIPNTMDAIPRYDPPFWERYINTVEPTNDQGIVTHYWYEYEGQVYWKYSDVGYKPPQITARLSLQLAPGDDFSLPDYSTLLTDWFGVQLAATFFDPYIHVIELSTPAQPMYPDPTGNEWDIPNLAFPSPGVRRLVVPTDWLWPEAGVHIADAYSKVTKNETDQPIFSNGEGWWTDMTPDPYCDGNSTLYQGKLLYEGQYGGTSCP
jgi:hypothetical protein